MSVVVIGAARELNAARTHADAARALARAHAVLGEVRLGLGRLRFSEPTGGLARDIGHAGAALARERARIGAGSPAPLPSSWRALGQAQHPARRAAAAAWAVIADVESRLADRSALAAWVGDAGDRAVAAAASSPRVRAAAAGAAAVVGRARAVLGSVGSAARTAAVALALLVVVALAWRVLA